MSTKTLRKRIALATVAVLGAGVLSLVSTSVANAAAGDTNDTAGSIGLLGTSNINVASSTTSTASLLSTGQLVLTTTTAGYFKVSAGAVVSAVSGAGVIDSDQAGVTTVNTGTFTVKPTGAAGSTFTIAGYSSSSMTSLVSLITVTISGASTYGVPSPSKSYLDWSGTAGNAKLTADASGGSGTTAGGQLYLQIDLRDAYGNPITTAGALTVTASTGAVVNINATALGDAPGTAGKYTTAVFAGQPATASTGAKGVVARIDEATTGTGWAGTVTVSYNGTVIGTKSGVITGYISKITLANHAVSALTGTTADAIRYTAVDSAGNCVTDTAASFTKNASSNAAAVSSLVGATAEVCAAGATTHASGKITVTGGGTGGKSDVSVKYVRPDGGVVTSNTVTHLVGGAAYSYTASLDKSSYAPGDLATLTIQFKDANGNPANSASVIETGADYTKATDLAIATPQLTVVGSYATGSSGGNDGRDYPDSAGQVTYTYTVGTTDGTYAASVGFPTVATGSAATMKYTVASGSTSLNDVLKGIVSLIASINKQIAALAKLVTASKKK